MNPELKDLLDYACERAINNQEDVEIQYDGKYYLVTADDYSIIRIAEQGHPFRK